MIASTMAAAAPARPHRIALAVSPSHGLRLEQLRRRAGRAYVALRTAGGAGAVGEVTRLAEILGVHHTTLVHRRQGQGGLANVLAEVDAWERAGVDTTPLLEAMVDVQLAARAGAAEGRRARDLAAEEQAADAAEDVAEVEYLTAEGGAVPGAARRWRDRLVSLAAHHLRLVRVLAPECEG